MFPMVGAFCAIASFCGGLVCAHRPAWGTLPSAMLCAVIFALVLAMVGLLVWDGLTLTGRGGILLLCALGGGKGDRGTTCHSKHAVLAFL